MTIKFKKSALTVASIAGLALAATAGAATFNVSTDVENALTVTVVQDMSFGTLFATSTASATAADYSTLVLLPTGLIDGTSYSAPLHQLLSLGGASAARGSIAVGGTTPITVTLPNIIATTISEFGAPADYLAAGTPIELRIGGPAGDPNVARFQLVDFTLGSPTGGTAVVTATANIYTVTPSFASTAVEFGIGATIVTDTSGTRLAYEAGTYSGSFEVTASY